MSLPREILDQLLSGYLDGTLSADEQSRVEELLRRDPQMAQELEELRQLRASLRELYRAGAKPLGDRFADRVIESAVTQARAEGLSDDHPVVRLAEQPSTTTSHGRLTKRRLALVIGALAASILLMIGLVVPLRQDRESMPIAESGPGVAAEDEGVGGGEASLGATGEEATSGAAMAAVAQPDSRETTGASEDAAQADRPPVREQLAEEHRAMERGAQQRPGQPAQAPVPEMIADAGSTTAESTEPGSAEPRSDAAPGATPVRLGAILVLDVRRTEQGRATGAVRAAMRAASIEAASQKRISDQIASVVSASVDTAEGSGGTILYLQAPAKQLDRFFLELVGDQAGIESVAMSLVTDAPVLEMVQSIQPVDPTEVQHETAWRLQSDDQQAIGALSRRLADRQFIPLDATTAAMGVTSAAPGSQGADVMSQVLVLVR